MRLSIIIPVYNGEKYLSQTIKCVLGVPIDDMEVLLINDGSSDSSDSICREYEKQDSRIRYCYQENLGIVQTRNRGLTQATGQCVFFMDQDDIVDTGVLRNVVSNMIAQQSIDISFFSTKRLFADGRTQDLSTVQSTLIINKEYIPDMLIKPLLFQQEKKGSLIPYLGHVWAAVYRREFLINEQITFRRFVGIEDDYLYVLDSVLQAKTIATVCETGYYWRQNEFSETHRQKYSRDLIKKYRSLYSYINNRVMSRLNDADLLCRLELTQYQRFVQQYIKLRQYCEDDLLKGSLDEMRYICNDDLVKKALTKESKIPLSRYEKVQFICYRHGWVYLARCIERLYHLSLHI